MLPARLCRPRPRPSGPRPPRGAREFRGTGNAHLMTRRRLRFGVRGVENVPCRPDQKAATRVFFISRRVCLRPRGSRTLPVPRVPSGPARPFPRSSRPPKRVEHPSIILSRLPVRTGRRERIILGCSTRLGGREERGKGRAGPEGTRGTGRVREPRGRRQTRREMKNTRVAAFWSGRHGTFSTPRTPKRSRRRVIRCAFPVPRNSRAPRGGLGPDGRGRGRHKRAGSTSRRSTPIRARPSRRPFATP